MSYIRELRPYMYWLGYLTDARQAGQMDCGNNRWHLGNCDEPIEQLGSAQQRLSRERTCRFSGNDVGIKRKEFGTACNLCLQVFLGYVDTS